CSAANRVVSKVRTKRNCRTFAISAALQGSPCAARVFFTHVREPAAASPSDRARLKANVGNERRRARGMVVGRYIALDVLSDDSGEVVYAAYDPELDRKVEIRLLPAGEL